MPPTNHDVRYEADERPPLAPTFGLGFQYTVLAIATVVLTPAMLIRALMLIPVSPAPIVTDRLRAVGEETVHTLFGDGAPATGRDVLLTARTDGRAADLEFIASGTGVNLEDRLAMLSAGVTEIPNEAEAPLRLLRHYAASVRHQQYHDTDIATVRVEPRGPGDHSE